MKSFLKVLRGNLLVLTMGDIIRAFSLFITFPYFSLYIQALGGGTLEIGLVNSLRSFTAFFIYPVAGYLADRFSRVKSIVAAGYISAVLYSIFMLAPDWKTLAFGNFLFGFTVLVFPAMNALMADSLPPQRRGTGYSLWRVFPSAFGILSPYIGGFLITFFEVEQAMRLLYGLTSITAAFIATMNLKFLRETIKGKRMVFSSQGIMEVLSHSYKEMFAILKWIPKDVKAFTFVLMMNIFFNSLTTPYWVIYGVSKIGLSELQWGLVLLIATIVNVVLLIPAGIAVDRFGVKRIMVLSLALTFIPIFLFPFSRSFINTVLILIPIYIANAFLSSSAPTFMAQKVPSEKRGRVMATLGQGMLLINTRGGFGGPGMGALLTIPMILGSILSGIVYNYNPALPWFLHGLSITINAILIIVFIPRVDRRK